MLLRDTTPAWRPADAAVAADAGTTLTGWATGGTAAMTAIASYPNPFNGAAPSTCEVICQTTIGPCHTTSPERQDVSDGWDGIPVRLSLRILDSACQPVSDAVVEIWHTNYRGIYSGRINAMCNTAEEDRAAQYFRGYLRTDDDGRVDFNTCFPGWYSSRCVHIHVRIMTGDYNASDNATAEVITQLVFSDELVQSVFGNEPLYRDFGQPDTLLANDNVVGGESDRRPYIPDIARMSDGVMLASKTIIIRQSTAEELCTAQGGGNMGGGSSGGPPGPPDGGFGPPPESDGGFPPPPGFDAGSSGADDGGGEDAG
ncbi:MAG: intradiol ring-cleavage dioxygenase [Myxococcota bacterium]